MPLSDLMNIFVFTDGDGNTILDSAAGTAIFEATIGESLDKLPNPVKFDVISRSQIPILISQTGQFPKTGLSQIENVNAVVGENIRSGAYRSFIRVFEDPKTGECAALVIVYLTGLAEGRESPPSLAFIEKPSTLCVSCKQSEAAKKYPIYATKPAPTGGYTLEFEVPVCSACVEKFRIQHAGRFRRAFQIALVTLAIAFLLPWLLPKGEWMLINGILLLVAICSLPSIWFIRHRWMKDVALGSSVATKACMEKLKAAGFAMFLRPGTALSCSKADPAEQEYLLREFKSVRCPGCNEPLDFTRRMSVADYADAFADAMTRHPYECRSCHTLVCMTCAKHRVCPKCSGSVFDLAKDLLT